VRVLIVDDSMLFRKVVRDALALEPAVEVVGSAADGRAALEKIAHFEPDAITLDLEMPELDGLGVLRQLKELPKPPAVIVVSAFTESGAALTNQALKLGAFDFVLKPCGVDINDNRNRLAADLLPKIRLLIDQRAPAPARPAFARKVESVVPTERTETFPQRPPEIVAIGISTGGPSALHAMLPRLSADLPVPIVIVQHMPPKFTRSLADDLDRNARVHVKEAANGERLEPGTVYIAPGGLQTKMEAKFGRFKVVVTDDAPEKNCKPSVDYLFRSLADQAPTRTLGVIMTGMGDDGAEGCGLLKRRGGYVLAQDAATCVVYGMPRQVIEAGLVDLIRPLDQIADAIEQAVRPRVLAC
jgi:two-component system chemotaxis response regulator CheB